MALQITSVRWREVPNSRERLIFLAALLAFVLVFLKSCWFPSREALSEVQAHLEEAFKEKEAFVQAQRQFGAQSQKVEPHAGSAVLASYEEWAHQIARNPSGWVMQEMTNPILTKGLQVTGVEFPDPVRQGRVTTQEFTVSLLGSFPFLGRYLERLDRLSAPLLISHWEILSLEEEGAAGVKLTLEGIVYGWE
ncbi:MAG: hypothetical protein HY538_08915 [Deltaproteobacteria bacterium]|nr:hypothetical protein [Deltaproteobacteria bacterium]